MVIADYHLFPLKKSKYPEEEFLYIRIRAFYTREKSVISKLFSTLTPSLIYIIWSEREDTEDREERRRREEALSLFSLFSLQSGPNQEGWSNWTSPMLDCWNNCCPGGDKQLGRIVSDGRFQRKNRNSDRKVSISDIQEWSLQMRENKLTLDEFNVRKKQNEIQKLIGFSIKENEEINDLPSVQKKKSDLRKEKDDHLNKIEKELIVREKSIRNTERLLDEMLIYYESSFELEFDDNDKESRIKQKEE